MMRKILLFVLSLVLLLLAGLAVLFSTERGLLVIQSTLNRYGGAMVSVARVEGSLFGGFRLQDVRLPGKQADIAVQQVDISWRPVGLFKAELALVQMAVKDVHITLRDTPASPPENVSPLGLAPVVALPWAISLESLVVDQIRVVDSMGQELFLVDTLTASVAANSQRIAVKAFDLQGRDIGLKAHGNIEMQHNVRLDLLGNWRLAGFGFYPMAGTFSTSGPLTAPHVEIGVHSHGSIRVQGDFVDLFGAAKWTARLTAKGVDLSSLIEYCPKIELAAVTGDLSGDLASYRGHVEADGSWDALTDMHLVSDIDGDGWGIDFPSLRIFGQDRSAEALGGKISWRDIFSWEGRFLFNNFDPSVITDQLQGQLDAEFVSKGDVRENGVVASFAIARLKGLLREHQVSAVGNIVLNETEVQTDGLRLSSGEVSGLAHIDHAAFSWAEQPSWSAKVRLENFDPSWLYAEFPGSINGTLTTAGTLAKEGLSGALNITKISGTLRGNKLSGGGEIALVDNSLTSPGLVLRSGPSELKVIGRAGESLALDVAFSSPDLGSLMPEAAGSVSLSGKLQGRRDRPLLDADLKAQGLQYHDYRLGKLLAKIRADFSGKGQFNASLAGEKMSLAGLLVDRGTIVLDGTLASHTVDIDGASPFGRLTGTIQGGYRTAWRGELSSFQLATDDLGIWRQQEKTLFSGDRQGLVLGNFCLDNGESSACLSADMQMAQDRVWQVRGELSSLPLQWLNRLNVVTTPISGLFHADITANGNRQSILVAKVQSRVTADLLKEKVSDSEQDPFSFAGSIASLDLTDSSAQVHGDIRLPNKSQMIVNAAVAGAGNFATALASLPLRGNLELRQFNLASLTAFTGYGVEPSGFVNNIFTLGGTLGQPQLYGTLTLQDGGIDLPYQGISLENVVLSIQAGEDSAKITGTASSGPGNITVAGTLGYGAKGLEGRVDVTGSDFLLVNLPEYTFRVDPDIQVRFTPKEAEISGVVDVPYGLITPEQMTDSVSASEDVVFVNNANNNNDKEHIAAWPVYLKIQVRLGSDVHIDGYGLAGRLGGQFMVQTTADNILAARGELDLIDGTFSIYKRSLNIERGRMFFTGGPIDNPGVDVRALVTVEDEKTWGTGYTVGVDISGLVQDLQYHLFSDPSMEDTEILSLMLVGHSFAGSTESEGNLLEAAAVTLGVQGSGSLVKKIGDLLYIDDLHLEGSSSREDVSLVVGKRLTKDLYIGYDLNMFNQLGQFRVRYDLTRGFSVETRSSSESTGTDLLYSFER